MRCKQVYRISLHVLCKFVLFYWQKSTANCLKNAFGSVRVKGQFSFLCSWFSNSSAMQKNIIKFTQVLYFVTKSHAAAISLISVVPLWSPLLSFLCKFPKCSLSSVFRSLVIFMCIQEFGDFHDFLHHLYVT